MCDGKGESLVAVILVVDDDPAHVDILASLLGDEGHTVITASDGQDGLQRARASRMIRGPHRDVLCDRRALRPEGTGGQAGRRGEGVLQLGQIRFVIVR